MAPNWDRESLLGVICRERHTRSASSSSSSYFALSLLGRPESRAELFQFISQACQRFLPKVLLKLRQVVHEGQFRFVVGENEVNIREKKFLWLLLSPQLVEFVAGKDALGLHNSLSARMAKAKPSLLI